MRGVRGNSGAKAGPFLVYLFHAVIRVVLMEPALFLCIHTGGHKFIVRHPDAQRGQPLAEREILVHKGAAMTPQVEFIVAVGQRAGTARPGQVVHGDAVAPGPNRERRQNNADVCGHVERRAGAAVFLKLDVRQNLGGVALHLATSMILSIILRGSSSQ